MSNRAGTVTISIERFKELEAYEAGFSELEVWINGYCECHTFAAKDDLISVFEKSLLKQKKYMSKQIDSLEKERDKLRHECDELQIEIKRLNKPFWKRWLS